ncbi:MAG: hypothetical protein EO766_11910 [Hydrotalea sp. AMD]|uniref:hypothetical protein n=1 Tax=Hydrotalea sp. AMD TaxID=2501297 RepID=UPI0010275AE3|nr:hypothetical protein [Hydrotalea sp. AMD]RWZ87224.1 MAG: hypothetical protein EO766_11910 [Hydrotalea sp. AMD]
MYQQYVKKINESPYKLYLAATGGGQSFAYHFMKYPGASSTIAGITIPYGSKVSKQFLGKEIDKYVSVETARDLATKSYEWCLEEIDPMHAVGIGVSCSLATDDERVERRHKIIIAIHNYNFTKVINWELRQGLTREHEEGIVCNLIFSVLCELIGIASPSFTVNNLHQYLIKQEVDRIDRNQFDTHINDSVQQLIIVPGSYNPFHIGHDKMIRLAEQILGANPYVELSTLNADKGALDYFEVKNRLDNVPFDTILTIDSTFKDKALRFAKPGRQIYFVVGSDTWNRILNPKYAGDTEYLYSEFSKLNVRFLVINRAGSEILKDQYLDKLVIQDDRATTFDINISSTMIRQGL